MSQRQKHSQSVSVLPDEYAEYELDCIDNKVKPMSYVAWLENQVREYREEAIDRQLKSILNSHDDLQATLASGWQKGWVC